MKKKPLPGRAKRASENENDSPRSSSVQSPPQSPTPDESETPGNTPTKKKVRKKKKKHLEETDKDGVRVRTSINGKIDKFEYELILNHSSYSHFTVTVCTVCIVGFK